MIMSGVLAESRVDVGKCRRIEHKLEILCKRVIAVFNRVRGRENLERSRLTMQCRLWHSPLFVRCNSCNYSTIGPHHPCELLLYC